MYSGGTGSGQPDCYGNLFHNYLQFKMIYGTFSLTFLRSNFPFNQQNQGYHQDKAGVKEKKH